MPQKGEYNIILEDVFNKVKHLEKGILFECIGILEPTHADEIRKQFNIKDSDSYRDDFRVLEEIPFFNPILKIITPIISNPVSSVSHKFIMYLSSLTSDYTNSRNAEIQVSNVESSNSINNTWLQAKHFLGHISPTIAIVVVALAVVGLYFTSTSQNKRASSGKESIITPKSRQALKCSADLSLVIPCNFITPDLRDKMLQEKELSDDDTITLVDSSAYFLVAKSREEPMFQLDKNFTKFPEDGYLFIRLRISNGEDLMKIDLPGSLSRAIRSQEPMAIQEIGLRQDFSNLEKFHRA